MSGVGFFGENQLAGGFGLGKSWREAGDGS